MAAISARDVTRTARAEADAKVVESPPNSNRQKYGKAIGLNGVFWCGQFVWWVFNECGIDLRTHGIPHPESTNAFLSEALKAEWRRIPKQVAQPGDVVLYDFGVVSPGDPPDDADHIGICSASPTAGRLKAIEGNTSPDDGGSQRNGGGVYTRTRALSLVKAVLRPPYPTWSAELAAKEDDDMPIDIKALAEELINGKHITVKDPAGKDARRSVADFLIAINTKETAAARADDADAARNTEIVAAIKGLGVAITDPESLAELVVDKLLRKVVGTS